MTEQSKGTRVPSNYSPNEAAAAILRLGHSGLEVVTEHTIGGATVLDFGVGHRGSLAGGLTLAKSCMGGLADIQLVPGDAERTVTANVVSVRTDYPLLSCLGCQYAGWPVQTDDFFAMGSGPMRLCRGREEVLKEMRLREPAPGSVCGILESDSLPTESAIEGIADQCGCEPGQLVLGIAPSTSLAGSLQVVARSIETAMHKLHELGFDMASVVSGTGAAPLPPPAKSGDTIAGIGRTNDAMLYGATVTLWVDCEDDAAAGVISKVPSCDSKDHGRPFAKIFADYDHDFYKVDPALFSPAIVRIENLRTGKTFVAGDTLTDVLRESFGA